MQAAWIVEAFDVGGQVTARLGPGRVDPRVDALGLQRLEEALHCCVVEAVSLPAHRREYPCSVKGLAVVLGGLLGGFKRWSQHLDEGDCGGQTKAGFRSVRTRGVTLARASPGDTTRRSRAVLDGERSRTCERGGCGRCRGFAGCGSTVVPWGGRHATDTSFQIFEAAFGPISVIHGA
jgi:hypothetical protein